MTVHKVRYLFPGSLFPEEDARTLTSRSVEEARRLAPDGAYCFELYDTADPIDLGPEYTVTPKAQNKSGRYYLGGELFDREQIEAMGPDHEILAWNMRANKWDQVIRCTTGNFQPFNADDTLVEPVSR